MNRSSRPIPLLLVLLALHLPAAHAGPAPGARKELRVSALRAVVLHDQGREDLLVEIDYENAGRPFDWIVPMPEEPTLRSEPAWLLTALAVQIDQDRLGRSEAGRDAVEETPAGRSPAERPRGSIENVRFTRGDPDDLLRGLEKEKVDLLAAPKSVLREYLDRGWVLAVVRIVPRQLGLLPDQELGDGTAGPVRFRFAAPDPVCPLRATPWGEGKAEARVYLIVDHAAAPVESAAWEVHHPGAPNQASWIGLDAAGRFPGLSAGRGQLTVLASRGGPGRIQDPAFQTYDPLPDLRSADETVRAEAASCLGRARTAAGVPALAALLTAAAHASRTEVAGEDALSAIWALGEIGDTTATSVLLPWTSRADVLGRLEAIEALRRMGAKRALPVFLRGILSTATAAEPAGITAERRACLDGLVALGDSSIAPVLRGLAVGSDAERAWGGDRSHRAGAPMPSNPNLGFWSMAALAACGDRNASRVIRDAVVRQGAGLAATEALRTRAQAGGSMSEFPRGFWGGAAILYQRGRPDGWTTFTQACDLMRARPEARDAILRAAAGDATLPDAAKVVLLAQLERRDPADFESLDAIWRRALAGGPTIVIPVPRGGSSIEQPAVYDIDACSVAYTLARWGEAARLARLFPLAPAADTTLAPEIVHAMTWTGARGEAPFVAAYVKDAWNRAAKSARVLDALAAEAAPPRGGIEELGVNAGLDLPYRARRITRFLCGDGADAAVLEGLIADPGLAPALRLHWMMNAYYDRVGLERLAGAAETALTQISAGAPGDARVEAIARAVRQRIAAGTIPATD
jgi:hypothetical protein